MCLKQPVTVNYMSLELLRQTFVNENKGLIIIKILNYYIFEVMSCKCVRSQRINLYSQYGICIKYFSVINIPICNDWINSANRSAL